MEDGVVLCFVMRCCVLSCDVVLHRVMCCIVLCYIVSCRIMFSACCAAIYANKWGGVRKRWPN